MQVLLNVASEEGFIKGPVYALQDRFKDAGFRVEDLPDHDGWIRLEVTSGCQIGRVGVGNLLVAKVELMTGREESYTRASRNNLLNESGLLRLDGWPIIGGEKVEGILCVPRPAIDEAAKKLVAKKSRRGGRRRKGPKTV